MGLESPGLADTRPPQVAVLGVGNELAGDDGVGVAVVRALEARWGVNAGVLFGTLEADLLEVADWLPRAQRFVFVDAVVGDPPGQIVRGIEGRRAWAPSFHQTDLATTLETLRQMGVVDPFPAWEIWGITILPPREFSAGLSPPVAAAAREMEGRLAAELEGLLAQGAGFAS